VLATVVCVDVGPAGPAEADFSAQAEQQLTRFRGRALRRMPGRLVAAFDGPARAVRCAASLGAAAARAGLCLKAGLHTGECVLGQGDDGLVAGLASRLAARAEPAQVLVSRTVVDLVAGSGLRFEPRGRLRAPQGDDDWPVFAALPED
jgi:class 3 adenylate cyclase